MNFLYSIILGAIEGFTEFLPISSTAHLLLFSKIFNLSHLYFLKTFVIFIQSGSILGLLFIYWRKFFSDLEKLKKVIFSFIPTSIIGFLFYKLIKNVFFNEILIVLAALFIGGVLIIIFEFYYQKKMISKNVSDKISYKQAFLIGLGQSLALIPGVSRSAATILTGLFLGIDRRTIVDFSFLLSVPVIITASLYDLYVNFNSFTLKEFDFLIAGFLASFVFSIFAVKFLINFIKNHSFVLFGVYRIIFAIILGIYFYF